MKPYVREVLPAPAELVTDGLCHMGTFSGPPGKVNIQDAMSPLGLSLPKKVNLCRLKEWEAFQIDGPRWFILLAVYNTKSVGIALVMIYDKECGLMYRYERKVPFWKLKVPKGLGRSRCSYSSRDFSIEILNNLDSDLVRVDFNMVGFKGLPNASASFSGDHNTAPIVICQPFGENRPLYSHKALMPAKGTLSIGEDSYDFPAQNSCMIIDDHKGFYPFEMAYDWVTALGYGEGGVLSGFNLTDNQVVDHYKYNENCLWHGGKMIPLPPVKFHRPDGVDGVWKIRDDFSRVFIDFYPEKDMPVNLNLGLFRTKYHGPVGLFKGHILDSIGKEVSFDGFRGMGEKKYIRM